MFGYIFVACLSGVYIPTSRGSVVLKFSQIFYLMLKMVHFFSVKKKVIGNSDMVTSFCGLAIKDAKVVATQLNPYVLCISFSKIHQLRRSGHKESTKGTGKSKGKTPGY